MGDIRFCDTAKEAVSAAICASFGSVAMSVRQRGDVATVELGSMTPFGPVVHRWHDVGEAFVRQLLDDTVGASDGTVFLHAPTPPADLEEDAFAAFAGQRPHIPVMTGPDGRQWARWWSVAPNADHADFEIGDELVIQAESLRRSTVLRYRHRRDGRDAGLHTIIDRPLTGQEKSVVLRAVAIVDSYSFGTATNKDGAKIRTQLLMLKVPVELAQAFEDGRLPPQVEGLVA